MPNLRTLTPDTVARVRSGVVTALVSAATHLDDSLRRSLPLGKFGLTISGPGGIRRYLEFRDGLAEEKIRGTGALVLCFTGAESMARKLGGGKGGVIPIPVAPSFIKALKAFMSSSRRVGELSALRDFPDPEVKGVVVELLMTAALRGVAETAMADPWTAPKSRHMPPGIVELHVTGTGLRGWIECTADLWRAGRGTPPGKVNARLSFADMDTALGLFTGKVAALNALGRGIISIRGRVPMVQVLFPLMDRFGEIMQWGRLKADGAA